jgi:hypothetical protein
MTCLPLHAAQYGHDGILAMLAMRAAPPNGAAGPDGWAAQPQAAGGAGSAAASSNGTSSTPTSPRAAAAAAVAAAAAAAAADVNAPSADGRTPLHYAAQVRSRPDAACGSRHAGQHAGTLALPWQGHCDCRPLGWQSHCNVSLASRTSLTHHNFCAG